MAWKKGSNRSVPLPPNWKRLRARALIRDGYSCQHIMQSGVDVYGNDLVGRKCGKKATDVHHKGGPNDHRLVMLESLCAYHHAQETSSDAFRGKTHGKRNRQRTHPGLM